MNHQEIVNHLKGDCTREESGRVINWIKERKHESESREALGEIWDCCEMKIVGKKPDFEQMLAKIHIRILSEKPNEPSINRWQSFYHTFARVAAILILPLISITLYLALKENFAPKDLAYHELYTKPGSRMKLTLADGTIVWLNDGTTLKYPETFKGDTRQVWVDGEAYFEVKKDVKHPFIVDNPLMKTIVTGTKFNLNAYSSDNYFEATLLEGKIHLTDDHQTKELNPGQQFQFDNATGKTVCLEVDPTASSQWINGKLVLHNELLSTAIKKLCRWYNVEIVLQDPALNDYLLTATIEDEKLEQTFKLISLALPVEYNIKTTRVNNSIKRTIYMKKK